jgi:hypothetical protein
MTESHRHILPVVVVVILVVTLVIIPLLAILIYSSHFMLILHEKISKIMPAVPLAFMQAKKIV